MAYIDVSYILKHIPEELLGIVTADNTQEINFSVIEDCILEAENEINNYLSSNYNISEIYNNPPPMLRRIALKLVKYLLYSRKYKDPNDDISMDMADARKQLIEIQKGQILLYAFSSNFPKVEIITKVDESKINNDNFKRGF